MRPSTDDSVLVDDAAGLDVAFQVCVDNDGDDAMSPNAWTTSTSSKGW